MFFQKYVRSHRKPKKTKKQKTSRKQKNEKKEKKQYSRTLAKVKMQKSEKLRENQKNKIKQCSRTLANVKMQKSKKTSRKPKKNNIPGLLPVDPISRLLEYCFFWVFSRSFGFLHFYFCKSPGILFLLFFFKMVFSSFFLNFGIFIVCCFFCFCFFCLFLFVYAFSFSLCKKLSGRTLGKQKGAKSRSWGG